MPKARPVQVIKQRHAADCGVACLAMLLDKPYGDIAAETKCTYPVMPRRGLGIYHLEHLALRWNEELKRVYRSNTYLLDHPFGILGMNGGKMCWAGHWVIWKAGVIIEPWHDKRPIYGLEEYLADAKCRTATLLVLEGKR